MYHKIAYLINLFSKVFIFCNVKYDIVILQKFGKEISLNNKLLQTQLKSYKIKYVNSANNHLLMLIKDIYYTQIAKIVIIDGYSLGISNTSRFQDKYVIQIWHALGAIKKFGYQSLDTTNGRSSAMALGLNMHKNYTFVVSNGQTTVPYFQAAFQSKIKVLKLPVIDFLQKQVFVINQKRKVLYLPTYRIDSVLGIKSLLTNLNLDKYELVYKPHPNDIKAVSKLNIKIDERPAITLIGECDILITDYSAACFEAVLMNKDVAFYLWDYENYLQIRGLNIVKEDLKNVFIDASEVNRVLDNLESSVYLKEQYLDAKVNLVDYLIDELAVIK